MAIARIWLPVLLASALFGGCASLIVGGAAGGGNHNTRDSRTAAELDSDATITSTINRRYVNDTLVSALDVRVSTYQGVVTLSGTVDSQAAATRAAALARSTKNVRRVISRITVMP